MILSKCLNCNNDFSYEKSQSAGKFCSRKCSGIHQNKTVVESGLATTKPTRVYMLRHKQYSCSSCGISHWNGRDIKLQVDHIDGNTRNSFPDNLRWMCPNCHSQTETWGTNNIKIENRKNLSTCLKGKERRRKK